VLAALRRRDEQALAALRLTEREYKDLLWPELPQARDPRHTLTVDFHWENLDRQSRAGVQGAMGDHGGEDFELIEVVPEGVEELETCKLLRRVKLKVRRRADGKESLIRVCGSILVLDGQYKLVSFPS
jgi:hypothetical protein